MPRLIVGGRKIKNIPPEIVEVPLTPQIQFSINVGKLPEGVRTFGIGDIYITLVPPFGSSGWHMSMSRVARIPSWREIAYAREKLLPPNTAIVMMLPPAEIMSSNDNFVVQLHEVKGKPQVQSVDLPEV